MDKHYGSCREGIQKSITVLTYSNGYLKGPQQGEGLCSITMSQSCSILGLLHLWNKPLSHGTNNVLHLN